MTIKPAPNEVRGTPLDAKALKRGGIFLTSYTPMLRYAWDTGEAMGRYLTELKEGKADRAFLPQVRARHDPAAHVLRALFSPHG